MSLTEAKMRPSLYIQPAVIPDDVEITVCKPSRRGKKGLSITAQHKPHKHRVSWEAAEAQAQPSKTLAERVGSGDA